MINFLSKKKKKLKPWWWWCSCWKKCSKKPKAWNNTETKNTKPRTILAIFFFLLFSFECFFFFCSQRNKILMV